MDSYHQAKHFQAIIADLYRLLNYSAEVIHQGRDWGTDLVIVKGATKHYIEIKFFRSKAIPATSVKHAAAALAFHLKYKTDGSGILVTNAIIPTSLRGEIFQEYGIIVWDRSVIYNLLTQHSIELRDRFEKLLLDVQQGIDTSNVFEGLDNIVIINGEVNHIFPQTQVKSQTPPKSETPPISQPVKKGETLSAELAALSCGKRNWASYERKCVEILEYLFKDDLTLWEKQNKTDDTLSRFDLICRIASVDDYWKALLSLFNSRFILFEFKNYCEKVGQDQVYTTERYLYIRGLRSVAFILSRHGAKPNAVVAAKGALKEHGKLIMFLSDNDLIQMLKLKDNDLSPNDYMSDLLDKWLISLSR